MNTRLTTEWIQYVQELLKDEAKKARSYYPTDKNKPSTKESRKRFEKSEKGKKLRKKVDATRRKRQQFDESIRESEREMVRKFYKECPDGHHVDHIIPLGDGGSHCLANLQWMKKEINQKKHLKILLKKDDFPQCVISIRDGIF